MTAQAPPVDPPAAPAAAQLGEKMERDITPYPVPGPEQFDGEKFLHAPDLERLAHQLINRPDNRARFKHLDGLELRVCWKLKGGESGGALTLGKCAKASGLVRFFSKADFVIWVAADHARDHRLTRFQIEALVFHELLHAEVDEKGALHTRAHDAELFNDEVAVYGAWKENLRLTARAFEQLRLFEEGRES